jgi:KaiC/GvpD/RAD55 family RecA-like ATPase
MAHDESHGRLSHMTDNIIFLEVRTQNDVFGRTLRVAKARGINHDLQARELQIDGDGLSVVGART